MLILGIETATVQAGCALGGHEGVLASAHCSKGRRHAENLTPAIEFICAQAQVDLSEIGLVAVDTGPGLFTGLRVGIAAAKAIAGGADVDETLAKAEAAIVEGGFDSVDYVALADADSLERLDVYRKPARLLAAARIGKTRLIDNLPVG